MNGNQTLHLPSITLNYKALNTTTNLLSLNKSSPLFPFVPLEHYISTGAESFVVFLWEVAISFGSHSALRYQTFLSLDLGDIVSERPASTQISVVVVVIIIIIIIIIINFIIFLLLLFFFSRQLIFVIFFHSKKPTVVRFLTNPTHLFNLHLSLPAYTDRAGFPL